MALSLFLLYKRLISVGGVVKKVTEIKSVFFFLLVADDCSVGFIAMLI